MSLPAVLIRISTGEVLVRALYPREDMQPVVGLEPDLEWCVCRTPFPSPEYDPRYFALVKTEQRGETADAEFSHLHPWLTTFTTQKRTIPEILTSVENKERFELDKHVRPVEAQKLCILGMAILFKEIQGLTLNARQTAIKNRIQNAANKVSANNDRAAEIADQVSANQEPDLESGWSA